MSQEKKDSRKLDDFWDISSLVPQPRTAYGHARSTEPVPVIQERAQDDAFPKREEQGTVIKRYIPPHTEERLSTAKMQFDSCERYHPTDSLIHTVELKKWSCQYRYYYEFYRDAIQYMEVKGSPCDFVPFFSYVPQYNQLNEGQRAFYFWFRENARQGTYIQTDYSYLLLYIYELLNLGDRLDVRRSQAQLMGLWRAYHQQFAALANKLPEWICDFGLLHRLPPPIQADAKFLNHVNSLKEYFIPMPHGDMEGCARSLLRFCTSYDFRASKFFQGNEELFERHIYEAVICAVRFYSADGRLLSGITYEDSRLIRDAYAGALCVAEQKYRIELEYCSFSRSNELRFLIGDAVKYAENKIRYHLGIKSKMTVYSVPTELRVVLDAYFEEALPKRKKVAESPKEAYEALYDIPQKPFSLSSAAQIEQESWATTKDLVDAFEVSETEEAVAKPPAVDAQTWEETTVFEEQPTLKTALGDRYAILLQLLRGNATALEQAAREENTLPDTLADQINELAFECMGDAILEEADGRYRVIEDYRALLEE